MAKKEHLIKLQQGVNAWNKWRAKKPGIIPVLNETNLSDVNLCSVNFNWANLCETNLSGTNLSNANLSAANLKGADLSQTNLKGTNLSRARLEYVKLKFAQINDQTQIETKWRLVWQIINYEVTEKDLSHVDLSEADLCGVNLHEVDLTGANLRGTKLNDANLSQANLSGADLSSADITGADIRDANFSQANISGLVGANFKIEDFFTIRKYSDIQVNSAGPIKDQRELFKELSYFQNEILNKKEMYLPGIILYTEQDTVSNYIRDCFEYIDSLTGNLFHIYLLEKPPLRWKNSIFYWKQIIEFYLYKLIPLFQWCRKFRNKPYSKLEVYGIARQWKIDISNFPCFVIFNPYNLSEKLIFNVYKNISIKNLEYYFRDLFSELYKRIPIDREEKTEQLSFEYSKYFNTLKEDYLSIIKILETKYLKLDKKDRQQIKAQQVYDLRYSQFGGGLINADTVTANQIGGNITNYNPEQKQNLTQAAAEIQQILNQLSQSYPTATTSEKMTVVARAVDEIESNPTLKARVIGALKAGGTEAFKELIDHPLVNILLASIDGWQDAE